MQQEHRSVLIIAGALRQFQEVLLLRQHQQLNQHPPLQLHRQLHQRLQHHLHRHPHLYQPVGFFLSKYTAYLSGDTIVATVIDADRNTGATSEDTLTTAIKVENTSDLTKNLFLDLKENGLNSGTFLATIKTGTTTTGGASSSIRANSGTIKATQGGTATVIYTDTTPAASTLTKDTGVEQL